MLVNRQQYRTIWPSMNNALRVVNIIDQTQLPHQFRVVQLHHLAQMIAAIKTMQVRGAPLIGAAAAYGLALATQEDVSDASLRHAAQQLVQSRPTAVNLAWAVQRVLGVVLSHAPQTRCQAAWAEAALICDEDVMLNQAIGVHGLEIIQQMYEEKSRTLDILTHCNAGWLATVDVGTALAPLYAAHDAGLNVHVWVSETRPRNQGASLTAWELAQHGVPHTVMSDNAAGHLMQQGRVDMVIVGADRVTATGDVCNKIGTYLKAVAAADCRAQGVYVPFYAAVPSPTIDWTLENGLTQITIEERDAHELGWMTGQLANGEMASVSILPKGAKVANPAFDVTPARLVTGIITEYGIFAPNQLGKINLAK